MQSGCICETFNENLGKGWWSARISRFTITIRNSCTVRRYFLKKLLKFVIRRAGRASVRAAVQSQPDVKITIVRPQPNIQLLLLGFTIYVGTTYTAGWVGTINAVSLLITIN